MSIKKYQVIQRLEWSCPGMVLWVNDKNLVVGQQQNPENGLTYSDIEDECYFDSSEYAYVEEVSSIKSISEIKANYAAVPKSA